MTPIQENQLYGALLYFLSNNWDRGDDHYTEDEEHCGMIVYEFARVVLAFHSAFGDRHEIDPAYLDECRETIRIFEEEL